jgi:DNA-binding transcriptional MocR family regulator
VIGNAREAGIALDPMQRFGRAGRKADGLVFGYGAIATHHISDAIRRLARLMTR